MTSLTSVTQRLTWLAVLGLAFSLPFELVQPWVNIGPLVFTNLELGVSMTMALWAFSLGLTRRAPRWPAWLWRPLLAWALILMMSALLAPVERGAAVKFALRSLAGVASGLMVYDLLLNPPAARLTARLTPLVWALTLCALLAAVLGCAEVFWPTLMTPWLSAFKLQTTRVAGTIRASGPFGYANIAAQAWVAALVLLTALWPTTRSRRGQVIIALAIVILSAALVLTASRGGLVAILLTTGWLLLASWWTQRQRARAVETAATATKSAGADYRQPPKGGFVIVAATPVARRLTSYAVSLPKAAGTTFVVVLLLAGTQLALSPVQQARLQREMETGVMQAEYAAPTHLTLVAGQRTQVPVSYTHLRAHETVLDLVCRLLLEKKHQLTSEDLR